MKIFHTQLPKATVNVAWECTAPVQWSVTHLNLVTEKCKLHNKNSSFTAKQNAISCIHRKLKTMRIV